MCTRPHGQCQSSRSPATRLMYATMFPFQHGTDPRKRTFHRDRAKPHRTATTKIGPQGAQPTRYNHVTPSLVAPPIFPLLSDTPNLHQRAFPPPMARTHTNALPPQPCKNERRRDITDVISPHSLPQTSSQATAPTNFCSAFLLASGQSQKPQ